MTSGDLTFDLTKKVTDVISSLFLTLFRTPPFVRVSLRGPGAELEGGCSTPPPAGRGNPGPPAGRGLTTMLGAQSYNYVSMLFQVVREQNGHITVHTCLA